MGTPVDEALDISWMSQARCRKIPDPDIFFPEHDSPSYTLFGRSFCGPCPVRVECLAYAMACDMSGVWGGTSEAERRSLKRKRKRITCICCGGEDIMTQDRDEICLGCGTSWNL